MKFDDALLGELNGRRLLQDVVGAVVQRHGLGRESAAVEGGAAEGAEVEAEFKPCRQVAGALSERGPPPSHQGDDAAKP